MFASHYIEAIPLGQSRCVSSDLFLSSESVRTRFVTFECASASFREHPTILVQSRMRDVVAVPLREPAHVSDGV